VTESDERDAILVEEWQAALEDAELPEDRVRLIVVERPRPEDARLACWHEPDLPRGETDLLQGDDFEVAKSEEYRSRHLVVVWRDFDTGPLGVAVLAGKLRHELEHARQWEARGGDVFDLDRLLERVLAHKIEFQSTGAGAYYNFKPIEQDANAAASMYLRERYPEQVAPMLLDPEGSALVRSLRPPEGPDTLVGRTVAFLYMFAGAYAEKAAPRAPAEHLKRQPSAGEAAAAAWRALEAADGGNGGATREAETSRDD
jgi:hypothetical protein